METITILDAGGMIIAQYCSTHEADLDFAAMRAQGYEIQRDIDPVNDCAFCGRKA